MKQCQAVAQKFKETAEPVIFNVCNSSHVHDLFNVNAILFRASEITIITNIENSFIVATYMVYQIK
jgi:hypothetical protein